MKIGIDFAVLTILLFGSWAVPTKTLKIKPEIQAYWLTVGHFLLSAGIFIFVVQPIPFHELIIAFIAGFLWGIGIISGYIGIRQLALPVRLEFGYRYWCNRFKPCKVKLYESGEYLYI